MGFCKTLTGLSPLVDSLPDCWVEGLGPCGDDPAMMQHFKRHRKTSEVKSEFFHS